MGVLPLCVLPWWLTQLFIGTVRVQLVIFQKEIVAKQLRLDWIVCILASTCTSQCWMRSGMCIILSGLMRWPVERLMFCPISEWAIIGFPSFGFECLIMGLMRGFVYINKMLRCPCALWIDLSSGVSHNTFVFPVVGRPPLWMPIHLARGRLHSKVANIDFFQATICHSSCTCLHALLWVFCFKFESAFPVIVLLSWLHC